MTENEIRATKAVAEFLEACYPCDCGNDPECPGEVAEAEEIVRIVLQHL